MRCPKCGFSMSGKDLTGLRKLELFTILGDLMELGSLKEFRKWDGSHYYRGLDDGMNKGVIIIMINKMLEIRKQLKKGKNR